MDGRWVVTWATSAMGGSMMADLFDAGFRDQTVRLRLPLTTGGYGLRLRLSNLFGERAVTFTALTAGLAADESGAGVDEATLRVLTFAGRTSVTIPPGAEVLTDPVELAVPDTGDLTVSMFTQDATGRPTRGLSGAVGFVAPGDRTGDTGGADFAENAFAWFVTAVDVLAGDTTRGALVAIGDSLTAGGRDSWPGQLARRIREAAGAQVVPVTNVGIGGNRLLTTSPCFGAGGLARLPRDVLSQTAVDTVVAMWVNDLGMYGLTEETAQVIRRDTGIDVSFACFDPTDRGTAADVIAGYEHLIAQCRARGLRVIGGTTPPFKGSFSWSPEKGAARRAVNDWVRTSGAFDGFVDFAAAIADPGDPDAHDPRFDRGDHLHHNEAGSAAMAAAFDLALLDL